MTIGKPFKKGQSGNPGGRPKVVAEVKELARAHTGEAIETLVSIMTNPKLHQRREYPLQTHCSIEVMASRRSTSPVRVGLLTSFACQSPARLLRSGLRALGIGPHQHRVMVSRVRQRSRSSRQCIKRPRVDTSTYKSERHFSQRGRETWTTKIKMVSAADTGTGTAGSTLGGAVAGAVAGTALGVPVVGTVIGALSGAAIGAARKRTSNNTEGEGGIAKKESSTRKKQSTKPKAKTASARKASKKPAAKKTAKAAAKKPARKAARASKPRGAAKKPGRKSSKSR